MSTVMLVWTAFLVRTPSEKDRSWTGFRTSVSVVKFAESLAVDDVMVEQSARSYNTRSQESPVQDCDIYDVGMRNNRMLL
jgi:hypothetical protein